MPITIGSNISALRTLRSLTRSSDELGRVSERLSSGQRINRASDDAAGLSIASALNTKARVYTVATRNINDGISLANIADAAASNLSGILTRMRELATQSANGTYSNSQRAPLDREFQALSQEYERIVSTTAFNGLNLINGDLSSLSIEAGFGASGDIRVAIPDFSLASEGTVSVTTTIGTGTFSVSATLTAGVAGNFPYGAAVADMNNDNNLDVIGLDMTTDKVFVFRGNGNGTFQGGISSTIGAGDTTGYYIAAADFDEDGNVDVALTTTNGIEIMSGNGAGNLTADSTLGAGSTQNVIATDYNGDGNVDVIFTEGTTNKLWVYRGNGNGTFQAGVSYSASLVPSVGLAVGDVNGDGRSDIIFGAAGTSKYAVALQQVGGSFAAPISYNLTAAGENMALADLNGDNRLDLLVSHPTTDRIGVLLGNGNGTFGAEVTFTAGDIVYDIITMDVNGDGKQDLISSAEGELTVSVHLGNGNGTFQPRVTYQVSGSDGGAFALGDFNEDGVTDFVVGASVERMHVFVNGTTSSTTESSSSVFNLAITTRSGALEAITSLEAYQTQLSQRRGTFGAFMQRLEVGKNNLATLRENVTAAASRIQDADIAQESAVRTRLEILQNLGVSVLAQARTLPEIALQLLT